VAAILLCMFDDDVIVGGFVTVTTVHFVLKQIWQHYFVTNVKHQINTKFIGAGGSTRYTESASFNCTY